MAKENSEGFWGNLLEEGLMPFHIMGAILVISDIYKLAEERFKATREFTFFTCGLNLFFLLYACVYVYIKLRKKFYLDTGGPEGSGMGKNEFIANACLNQLRRYFMGYLFFSACLYGILIIGNFNPAKQVSLESHVYKLHKEFKASSINDSIISNFFSLIENKQILDTGSCREEDTAHSTAIKKIKYLFGIVSGKQSISDPVIENVLAKLLDLTNICTVVFTLLSSFSMFLCFYVLYSETIDDKTYKYTIWAKRNIRLPMLLLISALGVYIYAYFHFSDETERVHVQFYAELISGMVAAIFFIFFFARFESLVFSVITSLTATLFILYAYASIQMTLPIISSAVGGNINIGHVKGFILLFCLFGKVWLVSFVVYTYRVGLLFHYIVGWRPAAEKAKKDWAENETIIMQEEWHKRLDQYLSISCVKEGSKYKATILEIPDVKAEGRSKKEALDMLAQAFDQYALIKRTNNNLEDVASIDGKII